jgi:hypothetical protein
MLLVSTVQNIKSQNCPDLACTSFTIEKIRANKFTNYIANIHYSFTIKNIGNDTLLLKNIVIQNYISTDSNYNHGYAAGGAFIDPSSTKYLLPDSTYSSTFDANTSYSLITNPVLIVRFYLVNQTDCNTNNDWVVKRIDLPAIGCPDVSCTSFTVIDTTYQTNYTTINYNYTLKNIGTDTLFLKDIIAQSYVSKDSAYGPNCSAAGGGYIAYNSTKYLLPDSVYSSSYSSSSNQSLSTYSFLVVNFYFAAPIECTSNMSLGITKIKEEIPTYLDKKIHPEMEIKWQPVSKMFSITTNRSSIPNKFKVYKILGNTVMTGTIKYNESKVLPLAPGMYIIEVFSQNKRLVKKIIVE